MSTRRDILRRGVYGATFAALALAPMWRRGARADDLLPVKVGVPGAATDVGYYVAHAKGWFREERLDVSFIRYPSAALMIEPLAAGELQVGGGGPSAALYNAIARGMDIRIVADKSKNVGGRGGQRLLIRADLLDSGRVKGLADLKGLRIANGAPGSSASVIIYKLLKKAGLDPSDVEEVSMSFTQQVLALENGEVDAAVPPDPASTMAVTMGVARPLPGSLDAYPVHQAAVTLYSGEFASEQTDAARRFMRAFLRGVRYHNDSLDASGAFAGPRGEEVVDILTRYGPYTRAADYRSFILPYCDPNGALDMASLREDAEIFRKLKMLEKPVDMKEVVDTSLLDWAVKSLGPYKRAEG